MKRSIKKEIINNKWIISKDKKRTMPIHLEKPTNKYKKQLTN